MYIIKPNNELYYSEHAVLFERYSNEILLCISCLVRKLVIIQQRKFSKESPPCSINLLSFKTYNKNSTYTYACTNKCTWADTYTHKHKTQGVETLKPVWRKQKPRLSWVFPSMRVAMLNRFAARSAREGEIYFSKIWHMVRDQKSRHKCSSLILHVFSIKENNFLNQRNEMYFKTRAFLSDMRE